MLDVGNTSTPHSRGHKVKSLPGDLLYSLPKIFSVKFRNSIINYLIFQVLTAVLLKFQASWDMTIRSVLILSSHLRVGLPSGLFPSGLRTKTLLAPLMFPIRAICPANLILRDFIARIIFFQLKMRIILSEVYTYDTLYVKYRVLYVIDFPCRTLSFTSRNTISEKKMA